MNIIDIIAAIIGTAIAMIYLWPIRRECQHSEAYRQAHK